MKISSIFVALLGNMNFSQKIWLNMGQEKMETSVNKFGVSFDTSDGEKLSVFFEKNPKILSPYLFSVWKNVQNVRL